MEDLKFKPRKRHEKKDHAPKSKEERELEALEALEEKEGKSKLNHD